MDSSNFMSDASDTECKTPNNSLMDNNIGECDDAFDEFNKENLSCAITNKLHSRLSVLKCWDPLSSNKSNQSESPILCDCSKVANDFTLARVPDSAFDLLKFDASSLEEDPVQELITPINNSDYIICQDQFFEQSFNKSAIVGESPNISQMLNETINVDNVETCNLLGLSPVKQVVSKKKLDELQKYHEEETEKWFKKEIEYKKIIENLKAENECKINVLINENEEYLEKKRLNNLKEMNDKELETKEKLETLMTEHMEMLRLVQLEKDEILKDIESLHNELLARESNRVLYLIACDQRFNAINEELIAHQIKINNLKSNDEVMRSWIANNTPKFDVKYKETMSALETNNQALLTARDKYGQLIAKGADMLRESNERVALAMETAEDAISNVEKGLETRAKCLTVKTAYLTNVEENLREEIDLRVKENREMTEIIESLVDGSGVDSEQ